MQVHGERAALVDDRTQTPRRFPQLVLIFPVATCAVERLLVRLLLLRFGVPEDPFALSHFQLSFLWARESLVHHHLVVPHEIHFSVELRVEVILTFAVDVPLFLHGGRVALVPLAKPVHPLVVLPQIVIERTLSVGWGVLHSQAS